MLTADKVTEIFYLADEFCKFFDAEQEKSMLSASQDGKKHRCKPNRMSDAEIIVILIHFHSGGSVVSSIIISSIYAYIASTCSLIPSHIKALFENLFVDGVQLITKAKNIPSVSQGSTYP